MGNSGKTEQIASFLIEIIKKHSEHKETEWLLQKKRKIAGNSSAMPFFMAFSQAARYFPKLPLELSTGEMAVCNELVSGFRPDTWDLLQTARSFLMLNFPVHSASEWLATFTKLFETGDIHEQRSLYAALPIMPFPEAMIARAQEGLRTNITSVFDAIALYNPYPGQYLNDAAWNQMVLKAIFLQRPLYKIQNADRRRNPDLAKTLIDYSHERWAAGRKVMPELWRFVGPYLSKDTLYLIERLLKSDDVLDKQAALLSCHESSLKEAADLLDGEPELKNKITEGIISWDRIGKEFETSVTL